MPSYSTHSPEEPSEFTQSIDDAFTEFMLQKWFYIREWTGIITNPNYKYSFDSLKDEWMKKKKDIFGTTSNTEPKWTTQSKTKRSSTR